MNDSKIMNNLVTDNSNGVVPNLTYHYPLAKLMANENITVKLQKTKTASFDVKNRILYLPIFNKSLSNDEIETFIAHEVGHALWTPPNCAEILVKNFPNIPFYYFNLIEDIRIERKIKEKYPGLIITFDKGNKIFLEKDFYGIKNINPNSLSFPDRLNIYSKCGPKLVNISLSEEEKKFYKRCYTADTFEEVIKLAVELFNIVESEKKDNFIELEEFNDSSLEKLIKKNDGELSGENNHDSSDSQNKKENSKFTDKNKEKKNTKDNGFSIELEEEFNDSSDSQNKKENSKFTDKNKEEKNTKDNGFSIELKEINDSSLEEQIKKNGIQIKKESNGSDLRGQNRNNCEDKFFTQKNFENRINDFIFKDENDKFIIVEEPNESFYKGSIFNNKDLNDFYSLKINKFENYYCSYFENLKELIKKNSSLMVSEFNRINFSKNYINSQDKKSGLLDTNKIHNYKFSENIFKKVVLEEKQLNHGIIIFLDWSASMFREDIIMDVIIQTLELSLFCRKLGIPFKVYGFSTISLDYRNNAKKYIYEIPNDKLIHFSNNNAFIFEILSSEMNNTQFNNEFNRLLKKEYFFLSGGTPLFETIICSHKIALDFIKKNNIEKLNIVFLTDGQGSYLSFGNNFMPYLKNKNIVSTLFGNQINFKNLDYKNTQSVLLKNLKKITNANIMGFYIAKNNIEYKKIYSKIAEKEKNNFEKRKNFFKIRNYEGYDSFYVCEKNSIDLNSLNEFSNEKQNKINISKNKNSIIYKEFNKILESFNLTDNDKKIFCKDIVATMV